MESVLVQWRYNDVSQRDFLPRLGAAITHIAVSPDGALSCTSHSDNSKTVTFFIQSDESENEDNLWINYSNGGYHFAFNTIQHLVRYCAMVVS